MATPGISRTVRAGFDETLRRIPEALKSEGFGILTEIDVQETLRKKLGVEFRRYRILGACNPPFAHRALESDLALGLMMPCSVAVWEVGPDETAVMAVDPSQNAAALSDPAVGEIAGEVREKLVRALDRLA